MIVKITTTDGESKTVSCPGVNAEDIDTEYINQRAAFDVKTVDDVKRGRNDKIERLEQASGVGGSGKKGIANRLDDLESRIEELESKQS